jgi:hypothetical protein
MKLWITKRAAGWYECNIDGQRYSIERRDDERGWWRIDEIDANGYTTPHASFRLLKDADAELRARPVVRRNIMSGKEFTERADTPYYCSPSSETYWSM